MTDNVEIKYYYLKQRVTELVENYEEGINNLQTQFEMFRQSAKDELAAKDERIKTLDKIIDQLNGELSTGVSPQATDIADSTD